jgi:hypothetical protein
MTAVGLHLQSAINGSRPEDFPADQISHGFAVLLLVFMRHCV